MKSKTLVPIISAPALLWNGIKQLSGSLELWDTVIIFQLTNYKESHLSLTIPLSNITNVEEYLVFNLAKNGLRLQDNEGRYDLFVMDDVSMFKCCLLKELSLRT